MPIFGKKAEAETKETGTKAEDLPDELPSLAEEIVEKVAEKPQEGTAKPEGASPETSTDSSEGDSDGIPDELPDIDPGESPKEDPAMETEGDTSETGRPPPPPKDQDSFFKDIVSKLGENKSPDQVLKEMRQYWQGKLEREEVDMPSLIDIDKRMTVNVSELISLEQEWVGNKKQLDKLKVSISNNEAEIELKTKGLLALKTERNLIRRVQEEKRSQVTEHHQAFKHGTKWKKHSFTFDKAFVLRDGRKIFSLQELASKVSMMNEHEFNHYTHPNNHFSNWVKDVFHDEDLANQVAKIKSPKALADLLTKQL